MKKIVWLAILNSILISNSVAEERVVNLVVSYKTVNFAGKPRTAIAVNNQIPAPTLHFTEGDHVTLNVYNRLDKETAVHWHGMLVPWQMDGVLGITQQGIQPNTIFHYQFTLHQSGTYWYHAHSDLQEQQGLYGAFIIDPLKKSTFKYNKDYVVVLSDWSNTNPDNILYNLKKEGDYYSPNFPLQPSLEKFIHDYRKASTDERKRLLDDYKMMQTMRMSIYDISDVAYDAFLMNGHPRKNPWKETVKVGDVVRLRFIGAGGSTIFHVKIPNANIQMVHIEGNDVKPYSVSDFTVAPGETYDVLVKIQNTQPYIIYAESIDTVGAAYGALVSDPHQIVNYQAVPPFPEPLPVTREMMGMMMGKMNEGMLPAEPTHKMMMGGSSMGGMPHKVGIVNQKKHQMNMSTSLDSMDNKKPHKKSMEMNDSNAASSSMQEMKHNSNTTTMESTEVHDSKHESMPNTKTEENSKTPSTDNMNKEDKKDNGLSSAMSMAEAMKMDPNMKMDHDMNIENKKVSLKSSSKKNAMSDENKKDTSPNKAMDMAEAMKMDGMQMSDDASKKISKKSLPVPKMKMNMDMGSSLKNHSGASSHAIHSMGKSRMKMGTMMPSDMKMGPGSSMEHGMNMSSSMHQGMKIDSSMKHGMSMNGTHDMSMPTEPTIIGDSISPPSSVYKTSMGTKYQNVVAAVKTNDPNKPVAGVINMELFGYMERFIWFINGTPEYRAKPIRLEPGKRYRFVFTNTSMMHHPMHIHGHWFILRKGNGAYDPLLHTIDVPPGATVTADIDADASGQWFFHCHFLYHMMTGMSRVFQYSTLIEITKGEAAPQNIVEETGYYNRPIVRIDEVRPIDLHQVHHPMAHPPGLWLATFLDVGADPFNNSQRLTYKGLYGPDYNKLELFVEDAEVNKGSIENADMDIFYWHLISQFWAVKGGMNYFYRPAESPYWQPGVGIEGLMPYFIDTNLRGYYYSGSAKLDVELSRDTQITNNFFIRAGVRSIVASKTVTRAQIGSGLNQLRYTIRPYYRLMPGLNVFAEYEHEQDYGSFKNLQIGNGESAIENTLSFGVAILF